MYDIFDATLDEQAKALGFVRVPVRVLTAPGQASGDFTMICSTDRALFKNNVCMLYDLELLDERNDNLHHRNSGLDTTLAKLCAQHGVLVGINLANLRTLDPKIMGRVMQNIVLCRSHHATMAVFSSAKHVTDFANPDDIASLLRVLGMSAADAKTTMRNLETAYKAHLFKKTPAYVKPGIKRIL